MAYEDVFPLTFVFPEEETVLPEVGADGTFGLDVYKVRVPRARVSTATNS